MFADFYLQMDVSTSEMDLRRVKLLLRHVNGAAETRSSHSPRQDALLDANSRHLGIDAEMEDTCSEFGGIMEILFAKLFDDGSHSLYNMYNIFERTIYEVTQLDSLGDIIDY